MSTAFWSVALTQGPDDLVPKVTEVRLSERYIWASVVVGYVFYRGAHKLENFRLPQTRFAGRGGI